MNDPRKKKKKGPMGSDSFLKDPLGGSVVRDSFVAKAA